MPNNDGSGNLYKISDMVNLEHVSPNIDLKKTELLRILSTPSPVENKDEHISIYNNLIDILKNIKNEYSKTPLTITVPTQEVLQNKPLLKTIPKLEIPTIIKPEIPSRPLFTDTPKIDNNLLMQNFDFTSKHNNQSISDASIPTSYERQQFNDILYGSSGGEDMSTDRIALIESINELRNELSQIDNVNISYIPQHNDTTSISDLEKIEKLLLYKKNTTLHFETARDFMMVGINQMVKFFNGQNGRPNLVGWERTAESKINMLKSEVTKIASNSFKYLNIGSLGQIAISLLPSAIMYAITRDKHQNVIKTDSGDALQKLRDLI